MPGERRLRGPAGGELKHCVIGVRSRIGRDVTLRDVVIIGADRFETDAERAANASAASPIWAWATAR